MLSITLLIILITCAVSFPAFNNESLRNQLLFWPAEIRDRGQYYRFLTYGLVHGDFGHLAFNMFSLYSFGVYVEKYLYSYPHIFSDKNRIFYFLLYLLALIFSTIPDYFKYRDNYAYRALGASGAVSAVIFSGIMLNPTIGIQIFFIPINIPGYIFGFLYLGLSAYLSNRGGNIGHRAHFSGAIFGILFTIIAVKLYSGHDVMKTFVDEILHR
jgi:membrane associated rhomboid family serine protease